MADHSKPVLTSAYADFVTELDGRFDDLAVGLDPAVTTATNVPTNTICWSSAAAKWQKYNGSTWADLASTYAISISGNAATVTNGVVTSGAYADPTWITSLAGSKVAGAITGNAASATVLQTARTINGVSFNGSANISVNLNNNLTFNNGGSGAASGVNFSGSAATTISYNTVGAPSTTGTGASGTWGISISGNAATATTAGACSGNAATATTAGACSGNAATATTAAYATTAGNGGVTSVNGLTGAVSITGATPSAAFVGRSAAGVGISTWVTVPISDAPVNSIGAALSANGMTLPAGTYYYETNVPLRCTGSDTTQGARSALMTSSNSVVSYGATAYVGDWSTTSLTAIGTFTLSATTTVYLKVYTDDGPDLYLDAISGYVSAWAKFTKLP